MNDLAYDPFDPAVMADPLPYYRVLREHHPVYYLLQWESLADRDKKWAAFQADPAWISARAETEKDGAIVENVAVQLLTPTAFSSVK